MILSLEPVEGLRYLEYLAPEGVLVTSSEPFENIPDYPPVEEILKQIRSLPRSVVLPAAKLARQAGSGHAENTVMVGAASLFVPLDPCLLEESIVEIFSRKGEKVVRANLEAFRLGRAVGRESQGVSEVLSTRPGASGDPG